MFGTYNLINMIVIINVLIAMMNNSYQFISDHADIGLADKISDCVRKFQVYCNWLQPCKEWKFARSKLWLTYFEDDSSPLPPPFNIVPSLEPLYDLVMYLIGWKKNLNEIPVDRNGFQRTDSLIWLMRPFKTMNHVRSSSELQSLKWLIKWYPSQEQNEKLNSSERSRNTKASFSVWFVDIFRKVFKSTSANKKAQVQGQFRSVDGN